MIPELELDYVSRRGKARHLIETAGGDNTRSCGLDHVRVAAIAGLLKKDKGLLDLFRQSGAHRCMRFADTSPKMRRDVEDFHSTASIEILRFCPPGAFPRGQPTEAAARLQNTRRITR
jgi:hypothetical protein